MSPENEQDFSKPNRLEELEKTLYSRDGEPIEGERETSFTKHNYEVSEEWGPSSVFKSHYESAVSPRKVFSFLKKLLFASAIFFVGAAGLAFYVFWEGDNIVSSDNINIDVVGPASVGGGEHLPLQITIENQNNAPLESADLLIEFPSGVKNPNDSSKDLRRYRESLGPIGIGEKVVKQVDSLVFGEEGEQKNIRVSLEYRVKESNAIFSKEKTFEVSLSSSLVSVKIDALKEVNSGQETSFTVEIVSNSVSPIKNLMLKVDYPYGFEFTDSNPKPTAGVGVWFLGDAKIGMARTVKIKGKINGQNGEERALRFSVGSSDPKDIQAMGTVFLTKSQNVLIAAPFVGVDLVFGQDDSNEHIVSAGETVRADVVWTNNLPVKISNLSIEAKINGSIFNPRSVSVLGDGFYRSIDNTVIWDRITNAKLVSLNPGEKGNANFSFVINNNFAAKNPEMSIEVDVKGSRLSDANVPEEIFSTVSKKIKVVSELGLSGSAAYSTGPFGNNGPLPPRAEVETTYTVVWTLTNFLNDLSNVQVKASLPVYVRWLSMTSPSSEKISYNSIGGEIVWDVGNLGAGTGYGRSPRQVFFQIAFLPSVSQIGSSPILVNEIKGIGTDNFTDTDITVFSKGPITTRLGNDPMFGSGDDVVGR